MWSSAELPIMPLTLEIAPHQVGMPTNTSMWHDGVKPVLAYASCRRVASSLFSPLKVALVLEKVTTSPDGGFPGIDGMHSFWVCTDFKDDNMHSYMMSSVESCCSSSLNCDIPDEWPKPRVTLTKHQAVVFLLTKTGLIYLYSQTFGRLSKSCPFVVKEF